MLPIEHPSVSVREVVPQLPPEHTGSLQVRECVPVVAHGSADVHAPHAPHIVPPGHTVPSVEGRVHPRDSVDGPDPHVPPPQTGAVHERDSVPLSVHTSANPPQPLHPPHDGEPHERPSVVRVQAIDSERLAGTQAPAAHAWSVQLRVAVPALAHTSAPPAHDP